MTERTQKGDRPGLLVQGLSPKGEPWLLLERVTQGYKQRPDIEAAREACLTIQSLLLHDPVANPGYERDSRKAEENHAMKMSRRFLDSLK